MKRVRRKPTPRFFISVGILVAAVALAVFFTTRGPNQIGIVRYDIPFEMEVPVTIMRDETVVNVNDYSKVVFFVSEGENVSQGMFIAETYNSGMNSKLYTDLISTRQQIKDYQENNVGSIVVPAILEKDTQIKNKMQEISDIVTGKNSGDLVSQERKLSDLIDQKSKLLSDNAKNTPYDELESLYAKEQELVEKLEDFSEKISAEKSGVISFNLDGVESMLTPENLATIERKDLEAAKQGLITDTADVESGQKPLYRLVNNYRWVCILNVDAKDAVGEIREGTIFQMMFDAMGDRPYEGKVEMVRDMDDGSKLYAFSMTEDIGPLISVRQARVTLKRTFNGLSVPLNALYNENGKTVIKQVVDSKVQPIEVNTIIKDEDRAIIESANSEITIKEGQVVVLK